MKNLATSADQFSVSSVTSCSNPVASKTVTPIDTSGQFHNGPSFANYEELRNLVAGQEDRFAQGLTEHLIEYALGRPYGFTDQDLADQIVTTSKHKQYAVSEFIHALVQSKPFRMK